MSNGSGGSFDFGTAFEPERPRGSAPLPTPSPLNPWDQPVASAPPTAQLQVPFPRTRATPANADATTRRGQGVAWASLAAAVGGALCVGFGVFLALDSISFHDHGVLHGLDDAKDWSNMVALGFCFALLGFAGSIVSLVRSRPRTIAVIALVAALVLPIVGLIWGGKVGLDSLIENAQKDASRTGTEAISALAQTLEQSGISSGPLVHLLQLLLGS